MDPETFMITVMFASLAIALGYIFIDAFKRRQHRKSNRPEHRAPINVEELPQARPSDHVVRSMRLRHAKIQEFEALKADGKNQDALEMLASTVHAADSLGFIASDKRFLEQMYGLANEGYAGLYKVVFSQIVSAIHLGDKDVVGTLLATRQFSDIPSNVKKYMFPLLIKLATERRREDLLALIQSAEQKYL